MRRIFTLGTAIILLTTLLLSCDKEQQLTPNTNAVAASTNQGGSNDPMNDPPATFVQLATDATGDSQHMGGPGLDASKIEYKYDKTTDKIEFRITTTNLSQFASSPSVDFNFQLPNGTENSIPPAMPFRGNTMTHKSAALYADDGGSAPSSYSYNNTTGFARNNILYTTNNVSGSNPICSTGSNCITINVDVTNNTITCSMDRDNVITDAEIGSSKLAKIKLVANVGFQRSNNDLVVDGAEFTIDIN